MMPTLIENLERDTFPRHTRDEAARMLESLRAAYQGLWPEGRVQIRSYVARLARVQSTMEKDWEK